MLKIVVLEQLIWFQSGHNWRDTSFVMFHQKHRNNLFKTSILCELFLNMGNIIMEARDILHKQNYRKYAQKYRIPPARLTKKINLLIMIVEKGACACEHKFRLS